MSLAFETTTEDVDIVLQAHGILVPESEKDELIRDNDHRLTEAALAYSDMDDQTASVHDEIETILVERGVRESQKKFRAP